MPSIRRVVCHTFIAVLLATIWSASLGGQSSLNGHAVQLDSTGKLLAWGSNQAAAYDHVVTLATDYLLTGVPTASNGKKLYYSYSYADPGNPVTPVGWPHNPAGLYSMLTDSGLAFYAYSGNVAIVNLVRDVLTFQLDHGMTPSTWHWPGVAYASGDAGSLTYRGAEYGNSTGAGDGVGVIQPDKVGEIGVAFLKYYQFSGTTRFLNAAVQAADVLASHVRTGSATQSPWPFRVYAQTNVVREQYSAHVIAPIRLFDELIRLNLGNVSAYQTARTTAWNWLTTYPLRNNTWANYFEDVPIRSDLSNVNQLIAGETARYLMRHRELDPNWEMHVRGILSWIESTFAVPQFGANSIREQVAFAHAMGSHTSRYASLNAELYELTGDLTLREKAFRAFNWATYMCGTNGVVTDGPTVNHIWWTDGYGDYIKHFLAGLGAVPDWAPANESHLLRSTSVVRNVEYGGTDVSYDVADGGSQEVLRLNFTPENVTANGVLLPRVTQLAQPGWTFDGSTGVMRVRHDSGTQIRISSTPGSGNFPPVVTLNGPAGGVYTTPVSLELTATAVDLDGTIDHVEFLLNGSPLATVATPPYRFTWSSVPPGVYQLSAAAVDDQGGRSTTSAVSVTVSPGGTTTAPPSNLVAAVSGNLVNLTWSAPTDASTLANYRVYRSATSGFTPGPGNLIGEPPATTFTDPGLMSGSYYYRVVAVAASGATSAPSNETTAIIAASGLQRDQIVFRDGTGTVTTPAITTLTPGQVLLAFVAADGPQSGQTLTVTGAGLTWTLVRRMTTQPGSSEVWRAFAVGTLTNATVTSTPSRTGYDQSLTVVTFIGAGGVGTSAGASGTGAPSVSLTTTRAGSLVYAVGNDWDRALSRTMGPNQAMVHQWVDTRVGDTFWVQNRVSPTTTAGVAAQLNDTAPTGSRWNMVAVEVVPPAEVTVPNTIGLSEQSARSTLTGAGLTVGTVTSQPHATAAINTVIQQTPAGGSSAPTGSVINVVLSAGVTVPTVVGQSQAVASTSIVSAGLTVGSVVTQFSASVPSGMVISQTPSGSTAVSGGSAVNLLISSGPQLTTVPNAIGATSTAAASQINTAGLIIGTVTTQPHITAPLNTVIAQTPSSGTSVVAGSAVNLVLSGGVTVPNVVGQTQASATSLITTTGLTMGSVSLQSSPSVPAGSVVSQSPIGNTSASGGSSVNLVVSSGVPSSSPSVDQTVFSDGSGTRTTTAFGTTTANALLLAFVASDGPASGSQTATVSGAGLTWTLVRRANTQRGTSEIWKATANAVLTGARVTSTQAISGYRQSLTVVAFRNASGTGASVVGGASSGAPTVSLTTTRANSLVYGVGNDWDGAVARVLGTSQALVHQWLETTVGDTFWVQARTSAVSTSGATVQINATSPTNHRWNLAAVEIFP